MSRLFISLAVAPMIAVIGVGPDPVSAQFTGGGSFGSGPSSSPGSTATPVQRPSLSGPKQVNRPAQVRGSSPPKLAPTSPVVVHPEGKPTIQAESPSIPASLRKGLLGDRTSDRQLGPKDWFVVNKYLGSGLPVPDFAVPRGLMDSVDSLTKRQKLAIKEQLTYLSIFPSTRIDASGAMSIDNLVSFREDEPGGEFAWDRLDIAMRYAVYSAMKRNVPLAKIRFLTSQELETQSAQQREKLTPYYPPGSQISVYPISVDGSPVVEVVPPKEPAQETDPGKSDGTIMVTGGEPTGSPGPGTLPVANAGTSPIMVAASAGVSRSGDTRTRNDTTQPGSRLAASAEMGVCSDDDRPCFLSTVALHDRFRLFCSGALIAPDKILTAAHCVCRGVPSLATIGSSAPLGFSPPRDERLTVSVRTEVAFLDPSFCPAYLQRPGDPETYSSGDLAVLTLSERLSLAPGIWSGFAVLADSSRLTEITQIEVAGFGARNDDPLGGEKYSVPITVASPQCDWMPADGRSDDPTEVYGCHRDRELVAIDQTSFLADSCFGDSGAGAQVRLSDGSYALLAIVSRGLNRVCGDGGIYTIVVTDRVKVWLGKVAPGATFEDGSVPVAYLKHSNIDGRG